MRRGWSCPDLGRELDKPEGAYLPIPGSDEQFPSCPAAFLRTRDDVEVMSQRIGRPAYGEHLIEGNIHPYSVVSEVMVEIENGARSMTTVSPKVMSLVNIAFREKALAREYERSLKKKDK